MRTSRFKNGVFAGYVASFNARCPIYSLAVELPVPCAEWEKLMWSGAMSLQGLGAPSQVGHQDQEFRRASTSLKSRRDRLYAVFGSRVSGQREGWQTSSLFGGQRPHLADERAVVITGAGSGIGAATARRLARDGVSVVFCGRDRESSTKWPLHARARPSSKRVTFLPCRTWSNLRGQQPDALQQATGQSVKLARVDQCFMGKKAAAAYGDRSALPVFCRANSSGSPPLKLAVDPKT